MELNDPASATSPLGAFVRVQDFGDRSRFYKKIHEIDSSHLPQELQETTAQLEVFCSKEQMLQNAAGVRTAAELGRIWLESGHHPA